MGCPGACDKLAPGLVSARHIQMLVVIVLLLLLLELLAKFPLLLMPLQPLSLAHLIPC